MNNEFSILNHNNIQILVVQDLVSEFENKKMLAASRSGLESGQDSFVVDLSSIDYMNSVGLNFLLQLEKQAKKRGGGIAVANASKKVVHLLEITKLKQIFNLNDSIEEAIQSLAVK